MEYTIKATLSCL